MPLYSNFVCYDCSHIEHVHPILCAHLIFSGVLNINIITSTLPLEFLHCVICVKFVIQTDFVPLYSNFA